MSVFTDIQRALNAQLDSLPDSPDVAYQNQEFKPANGVTYLRVFTLPAETNTYGLGYQSDHQGIYQVDVVAPLDKLWHEAVSEADQIADHFAADRNLNTDSGVLNITNISRNQGLRIEDRYIVSVSITYRLLTTR